MKTKEFLIAIIFIVASLFVYGVLPVEGTFQQVIATLVFFVALPLLFNKFILKKETLKEFNLRVGDYKQGILWGVYSLVGVGFIFLILSYFYKFLNIYTVPVFITNDFGNFVLYELIIVTSFVVVYEFYLRGFLMPILQSKLKYWAILAQAVIFAILIAFSDGGNIIQFIPYLVVAPFAGIVTYKSRSIFYSAAMQFIVIFVLNIIVIRRIG